MELAVITPLPGRTCGECNACCKVFPIPDVGKDDTKWCRHCEIGKGCTIYEHRPTVCRDYVCMWLHGVGDESYRPDRIGVLISPRALQGEHRWIDILHLWETRPEALRQQKFLTLIHTQANRAVVVACHRIVTVDTYECEVIMRRSSFTSRDLELINDVLKFAKP